MNTLQMHKCDCGNDADNYLPTETLIAGNPPQCSDCAHAEECPWPEDGAFTYGHAIASCNNCTYRCGYWECGCDLSHSCKDYPRNY